MPTHGRLTPDRGYSMPLDSPLYGPLPIPYRDITLLLFEYETDPEAAASLLPTQVTLPDRPTVKVLFATYPWTTIGPYNEVAQLVKCSYQGQDYDYAVRLHVTNDEAMAAGREIAGFPKKLAKITYVNSPSSAFVVERPLGLTLATAVMEPVAPLPAKAFPIPSSFNYLCLRVIPSPTNGQPPSLAQLVRTTWVMESGEAWAGRGTLRFTGASDLDPYHTLPIRRMTASLMFLGNMRVDAPGTILETL